MSSDFVPEFKLGSYAYETLFNKRETSKSALRILIKNLFPVLAQKRLSDRSGLKERCRIVPSEITKNTPNPIPSDMVDTNQKLENGTTVYDQIKDTGLGQIPFGAAVALADNADTVKDVNGNTVNEGNEAFYPRNVIFNKYFNKHNICVITPSAIMSNSTVDSSTRRRRH
jgi:hypothetical protein